MSKALVTFGVAADRGDHAEILRVTLPAMERYAARHGYELVVAACESGVRNAVWGKIVAIQDALAARDEVLWIDADCLIVDPSADVAEHVPPDAWQALAWMEGTPNCGVWLVRRPMLPILAAVWEDRRWDGHCWQEQASLIDKMGYRVERTHRAKLGEPTELYERTHQLPEAWNTRANRPPDKLAAARIVHAANLPDRAALLQSFALRP